MILTIPHVWSSRETGDPMNNSVATTDPYKTLFVGRINYDTTESKLRREFEAYGPVQKVCLYNENEKMLPVVCLNTVCLLRYTWYLTR